MNSGFSGADFEDVRKEELKDSPIAADQPVLAAPEEGPVNASSIKEDAQPFDPNNLGTGVTVAPPSEGGTKPEEDLSQYSNGDSKEPMLDPTLPNTDAVDSTMLTTRFNPVTGEEVDLRELRGETIETEPVQEEKLKTVEIDPVKEKRANSIALIIFFVFLIAFVIFLPEIQTLFSTLTTKQVNTKQEITTGKLVCTLETSTSDLDKEIQKTFSFEDNKLKTGKFISTIKGDASADDEDLVKLSEQCEKIKASVEGLEGVEFSCTLESGKLIQSERFEYEKYDVDKVSKAYMDADSSIMDYQFDQDIDQIMLQMRQSGYKCEKNA